MSDVQADPPQCLFGPPKQEPSTLEHLRHAVGIWAWLPCFVTVATSETLRAAASKLFITPSACSRTLSKLEERLGCKLFVRRNRGLVLNERGRILLNAVRPSLDSIAGVVGSMQKPEPRPAIVSFGA